MYDSNSKGISYMAGFFMLIAFTIAGIVLFNIIAVQVWVIMTGQSSSQFLTGMTNPALSNSYKIAQVINMLGFFVPTALTAAILSRRPFQLMGFSRRVSAREAGLVCFLIATALFVGGGLSNINQDIPIPQDWKISFDKLEQDYRKQANAIMVMKNTGDYLLALIVMGFVPAFCEETLFRGGLQNFLTRASKRPWLAIIIVSLIFSAAHFSFYGFLFRMFLGIVLGLIYHYSGNLWLSILAHFINNAVVVTVYYSYLKSGKPLETIEEAGSSYWGLMALPVLIILFMTFKRLTYGSAILAKRPGEHD